MKILKLILISSTLISYQVSAKVEEFIEPRVEGLRMDICLSWGDRDTCKKPAAYEWCLQKGYTKAIHWEIETNIGKESPTKLLSSKEICAKKKCDAFKVIVCYSG